MQSASEPCAGCGSPLAGEARFCMHCGRPRPLHSSASRPASDPLRDQLIAATQGEYQVFQELGRGGMAAVYLAADLALGRHVAIKVMVPGLQNTAGMADRFLLEARTSAQLSHANIIPIYAVRTTGELRYFVMKFVPGRSLDQVLAAQGPLPPDLVSAVLAQVGAALEHAHARGVVHRDVKPANIMLDEDGSAIVADFGIAKVAQGGSLTRTGATIGTPAYMSPEQCTGQPVAGASDQYALGCVAFELLTGRPPFVHEEPVPVLLAHVSDPPPPIIPLCHGCPYPLAAAIERMMAKSPAERWPTIAAAIEASESAAALADPSVRVRLKELARVEPFAVPVLPAAPVSPPPHPTVPSGGWRAHTPEIASLSHKGAVGGSAEPEGRVAEAGAEIRPTCGTLTVLPGGGALVAGQVVRLSAMWKTGAGSPAPSVGATWSSSDPDVLRVTDDGELTAVRPGGAAIRAEVGGERAEVQYLVTRVDVASVRILPRISALSVGEEVRLETQAVDRLGTSLTGRVVTWQSSNSQVVAVSADGAIRGIGAGSARISAAIGAGLASIDLRVNPALVGGIRIDPAAVTIRAGEAVALKASVQGTGGTTLPGVGVEWQSSDPQVASVSADGVVRGLRFGSVRIAASAGGRRATVAVEVRTATVTTISAPRIRVGGEKP